jgi:hypothetical protein
MRHTIGSTDCVQVEHCISHDEDEKITSGTFKVCFECFHVFPTIKDLVDAEEAMRKEMADAGYETYKKNLSVFSTLEIRSCPFCSHDW